MPSEYIWLYVLMEDTLISCFWFWFTETSSDYRFTGIREVHRVTDCKGLPEEKDCVQQYRSMLSCKCWRNCEFHLLFLFVDAYFWASEKRAILWHTFYCENLLQLLLQGSSKYPHLPEMTANVDWPFVTLWQCEITFLAYLCVRTTALTIYFSTFRFQFMTSVYLLMIWSKKFNVKGSRLLTEFICTKDSMFRGTEFWISKVHTFYIPL
jgi:hypothetical protein